MKRGDGTVLLRVRHGLTKVSQALACGAAACVGVTAAANVVEVIARYFLNSPLNWGSDISVFALCACIFMALPEVTRRHDHVSITIIPDAFRARNARRYRVFLLAISCVVCLVVAWFAFEITVQQHDRGVLTNTANQIPRWWLTASVGVGLVLSAVNFVVFATAPHQKPEAHGN